MLILGLTLLAPLSIFALPQSIQSRAPAIHSVINFSNFVLENLAPRSNGHLLLTASNQPYVYNLDPSASSPTPKALPPIPNVGGLFGIVETSPDVFAVAAGNYSSNEVPTPGSFSVWSIDMNPSQPTVKLITTLPQARGLNGAAALNGFSGSILIADSVLGGIWTVNVGTGHSSVTIQNADMAGTSSFGIGINGVRVSGSYLYYTNSAKGTLSRIQVSNSGSAVGNAEVVATSTQVSGIYDDLDVDSQGNAWVAMHPSLVEEVTQGVAQPRIIGQGSPFVQPTSARFGRGSMTGTLYVVDAGDESHGGQLFAVSNL